MGRSSGWPLRRGGLVPDGSVRVTASGWSPGGRTGVALEWDLAPLGTALPTPSFTPTSDWQDSGPVLPPGISAAPLEVLLSGLAGDTSFHCRFRVATRSPYFPHSPWLTLDDAPEQLAHFRTGAGTVGTAGGEGTGTESLPLRAAPNPFRRGTRIEFENAVAGMVRLRVFDARGRLVSAPEATRQSPGHVALPWDGRDGAGRPLAGGVYFLRVETPDAVLTARIHKLPG